MGKWGSLDQWWNRLEECSLGTQPAIRNVWIVKEWIADWQARGLVWLRQLFGLNAWGICGLLVMAPCTFQTVKCRKTQQDFIIQNFTLVTINSVLALIQNLRKSLPSDLFLIFDYCSKRSCKCNCIACVFLGKTFHCTTASCLLRMNNILREYFDLLFI